MNFAALEQNGLSALALALLLASAFTHAVWNLFAKRVSGGATFVWLFSTIATVIYGIPAIIIFIVQRPALGLTELLWIIGSSLIQLIYFLCLQKGYVKGDLSLVYPLARGTGPLLATIAAILLLGERPTPHALAGAVLIALGVFILTSNLQKNFNSNVRWAVVYGLITGCIIAAATLWDKYAVSMLMIPPVMLYCGVTLGQVICLTPLALRHWESIIYQWRTHRTEAIGIGLLSPLSYILALTALSFTPVSYAAPTREISILISVLIGKRLLSEKDTTQRMIASGVMVLGVVVLALN